MADNWRTVVAEWIGEDAFEGKNSSGASVTIGTFNGKPGIGPMEMLLLGVAGCTGMDITSILRKKRQDLRSFQVIVRGNKADTYPKVYTEITIEYVLWGENIDPKAVEQAIELSETKYCSASAMMSKVARITSSYRILAPGQPLEESLSL